MDAAMKVSPIFGWTETATSWVCDFGHGTLVFVHVSEKGCPDFGDTTCSQNWGQHEFTTCKSWQSTRPVGRYLDFV